MHSTMIPQSSSEDFSIEDLIQRVEGFQRRDQLDTLAKLVGENCSLQQHILLYQKHWCTTLDILDMAHAAVLLLENALTQGQIDERDVAKAWIAIQDAERDGTGCRERWI
jgi:hypothetical protein